MYRASVEASANNGMGQMSLRFSEACLDQGDMYRASMEASAIERVGSDVTALLRKPVIDRVT